MLFAVFAVVAAHPSIRAGQAKRDVGTLLDLQTLPVAGGNLP